MKGIQSILVLLIVFVAAGPILAADPPVEVQASITPPGAAKAVRPPAKMTPMMEEIQVALETSRAEVAELALRLEAAADETEALMLAREIRRAKLDGKLTALRIQLRFARDEGREEAVTELEDALTRMTASPRTGQPILRPAPQRPVQQ